MSMGWLDVTLGVRELWLVRSSLIPLALSMQFISFAAQAWYLVAR